MKRAFTLVELMVVISIIGILIAILVTNYGGTTESARAAHCLANMKNLANGVQSYLGGAGCYPLAGSCEAMSIDLNNGSARKGYSEWRGWVSWDSRGAYAGSPQSHVASASWFTSAYNQETEVRMYALTNGALWTAVSGSADCYTCPSHVNKMRAGQRPCWSYVMSAYFGWDHSQGGRAVTINDPRKWRESVTRTDKRLLFAELQWSNLTGSEPNVSASPGLANDCVLQYRNAPNYHGNAESIGFNHTAGRDVMAHVVFADGHAEKLVWRPDANLQELTEWLCDARDVAYDTGSKKYVEMK